MEKKFTIVHSSQAMGGDLTDCAGGNCPTIYKTNSGHYVVQGKKLSDEDKKTLNIPNDEDIIEVPMEFLNTFLKK